MAQYSVDHTCGHSQTHQIFGKTSDRERKLAWLESTTCSDCYTATKDKARVQGNADAAAANAAAGLPVLGGHNESDKQIAWAETIRRPICEDLRAAETILADVTCSDQSREEFGDAVALVVDEVVAQTSAKWWIDSGRALDVSSPTQAVAWIVTQVRERGLAVAAMAEFTASAALAEANRLAAIRREEYLCGELALAVRDEDLSLDQSGDWVSGAALGHTLRMRMRWMGTVEIDGTVAGKSSGNPLANRLLAFSNRVVQARAAEAAKTRDASLIGCTVKSVSKTGTSLTVTLSDGRDLYGVSSRQGWELNRVGALPIDPGQPQAARLATEAKAAHKTGKGA